MKNKQKSFTLIELLVVIAIIGIISSIVLVSIRDVKMTARDVRRKGDFHAFVNGLELFYGNYAVYPCGDADAGDLDGDGLGDTGDGSGSMPFLNGCKSEGCSSACIGLPTTGLYTEKILGEVQRKDPINEFPYIYGYSVSRDRQKYILYVHLEKDTSAMLNDGGRCSRYYEIGPGLGKLSPAFQDYIGGPCN